MGQRLKGKAAVVTGSGGGIGRGIALLLAEQGAQVVVNDIGKDASGASMADSVVAEIKKAGGIAIANYDSVATMAGGQNITKTATSNFGRIDILVNCAGNYKSGNILDITEEAWDAVIAVHLKGHFCCIQPAAKEMVKQKSGGRIINFTSNAAFHYIPPGATIAYAAAKAGVAGMTASLSASLKDYGITVNGILPSAVTNLFPNVMTKRAFGTKKKEGPEYVAPTVVCLCTEEAKNITGQLFYAGAGEVIAFNRPLQLPGPHMYVRKDGMWTVDELVEVITSMVGQG